MDTEQVLRRFRNERQILANFDHPNIARLLSKPLRLKKQIRIMPKCWRFAGRF
ncbi:hypothetical protein L0156_07285 [bacterium]|nr:hypothetical protein [bacterium]